MISYICEQVRVNPSWTPFVRFKGVLLENRTRYAKSDNTIQKGLKKRIHNHIIWQAELKSRNTARYIFVMSVTNSVTQINSHDFSYVYCIYSTLRIFLSISTGHSGTVQGSWKSSKDSAISMVRHFMFQQDVFVKHRCPKWQKIQKARSPPLWLSSNHQRHAIPLRFVKPLDELTI